MKSCEDCWNEILSLDRRTTFPWREECNKKSLFNSPLSEIGFKKNRGAGAITFGVRVPVTASHYPEADLNIDNYRLKVSRETKIIGLGDDPSD